MGNMPWARHSCSLGLRGAEEHRRWVYNRGQGLLVPVLPEYEVGATTPSEVIEECDILSWILSNMI